LPFFSAEDTSHFQREETMTKQDFIKQLPEIPQPVITLPSTI
jgi:hypothetical protein